MPLRLGRLQPRIERDMDGDLLREDVEAKDGFAARDIALVGDIAASKATERVIGPDGWGVGCALGGDALVVFAVVCGERGDVGGVGVVADESDDRFCVWYGDP